MTTYGGGWKGAQEVEEGRDTCIHTHTHIVITDLSCFMTETQENALVIANTLFQQHKRRLYTWTSPDGQYGN